MRAENLTAVGFSLGLHACLLLLTGRTVPTRTGSSEVTVSVSFEAPRIDAVPVSAAPPRVIEPDADPAPVSATAPAPLEPVFLAPGVLEPTPAATARSAQRPLDLPAQIVAPVPADTAAEPSEIDGEAMPAAEPHLDATRLAPDPVASTPPAQSAVDATRPDIVRPVSDPVSALAGHDGPLETLVPRAPDGLVATPPPIASLAGLPAASSHDPLRPGEAASAAATPPAIAVGPVETAPPSPVAPSPPLVESNTAGAEPQIQDVMPAPQLAVAMAQTIPAVQPHDLPALMVPDGPPDRLVQAEGPETAIAPLVPVTQDEPQQVALAARPQEEIVLDPGSGGTKLASIAVAPVTERLQRIRRFIDRYDGGPCFYAAAGAISETNADVESFSATADTFKTFDSAFKAETGLEAKVVGQRVWSAQCAAVAYLRRLTRDGGSGPVLDLDRRDLQSGDSLSGTLRHAEDLHLGLFVISERGAIQDVSDLLSDRGGTTSFSFRPNHADVGGPFPQMLVVVASRRPVQRNPTTVDDLFKPILDDAAGNARVAAKLFLVTR